VSDKIVILPQEVREKIRAGEVIERPASVVKELIENSIDAESTQIICEVERGGAKRIKVIDNGIGMSPDDLVLCIERYATSKIRTMGDLVRLETLGFRGEALPSIRAIAELTIESKRKADETGFLISTQENEIIERRPQPRIDGTSVEIKRLFFNTPARRKFLKSDATEFRHIRKVFLALALAHNAIHFKLINNGSVVLGLPPAKGVRERLGAILDLGIEKDLLEFKNDVGVIVVHGVVSKPEHAQSTRDAQYIFVNKRWIQSATVRQAIYKAYGKSLWGKHPVCVIEIALPGSSVDINVHPAKREVKFRRENEVFEAVYASVQGIITSKEMLPRLEREGRFIFSGQPTGYVRAEEQTLFAKEVSQSGVESERMVPKGFWQLHGSYIFASTKTGFMIVDQHAAHERIIYDQIVRRKEPLPPQMLLFPLRVDLALEEGDFLEAHVDSFYELGFRMKKFSGNTMVIEGIPPFMREINEEVVHELLQDIIEDASGKDAFQKIAQQVACKAAMKAGEELAGDEMNKLFDSLFATDDPYTCPHGRPTMIKFTVEELERKFRRR
jgi:DNA mismatch repair protein MutL